MTAALTRTERRPAEDLRRLASQADDAAVTRRLLALASVLDGASWADAAYYINEKALEDQQSAFGVSSILSKEQIERAPETNLSDILTRLPGLSTYSTMNQGQAATGESQYVTIRGLASSYNAYSLNGERIATADPTTRAISFDVLAPHGITQINVSKTATADMDGDATGGAIDIRTPTAFDFGRSYGKITMQGN